MIGNKVADLTQQREPTLRWLLFSAFCFHNRALWHGARQKPTLFSSGTPSAYGMAVHYLWPQSWQRYAMPSRINWIMTALVNHNVPVLLISTAQFYISQKRVEGLTGWASEQFTGRIGHVERLPERVGKSDLQAVAKALLPQAGLTAWQALAAYAQLSKRHLASIEAIAKRANWLAAQDGRSGATASDVSRAMKESVIPSDTALASSLAPALKARRNVLADPSRGHHGGSAEPPPPGFEGDARVLVTGRPGSQALV